MYIPFNSFVFRTPMLPVRSLFLEMEKLEKEESYWRVFLQNPVLQEALFLASSVLYEEIEKYLSGYLTKEKEVEKMKNAVLRYFSRMCSRCTPFGLFAGFSLGRLDDVMTKAEEEKSRKAEGIFPSNSLEGWQPQADGVVIGLTVLLPRRYTRLDMHYLCALAQEMGKKEEMQREVKYYPNSSLYRLGRDLRYVEYYYKNAKRIHQIASVDYSEYLEQIITSAKQGVFFAELVFLVLQMLQEEENIEADDAINYIKELIENQILVSELEPEITGRDFLIQLQKVVPSAARRNEESLAKLTALLKQMDIQPLGTSIAFYKEAEEIVKTTGAAYEKNLLFQVDMFKPAENATLSSQIAEDILEAIELMNRISFAPRETTLKKFADNFYERYEEREMPLLQVLDVESGNGYPANKGDISPLVEGYVFPNRETAQSEIRWNQIDKILHKKLIDNYKTNGHTVEFTDKDFETLKPNWDDLPQTFSCMCEIFSNEDSTPNIYVHSAGGSSAANMLGRFCHVDKDLEEYVKEITSFESSQEPDKIFAEIVHLPESRLGNILLRPVLRDYEIPYLAKASVPIEKQIPLSDLYISVKQGKIVLRSKRLNKEIVPRLSTAHNYSRNSMPVYHFLCDLQMQGLRGGVGFTWGALASEFDFLPRATYKNTILSLATWKVKTEEFKKLIEKLTENS